MHWEHERIAAYVEANGYTLGGRSSKLFSASSAMLWSRARKSAGDVFGVDGMLDEDGGQGAKIGPRVVVNAVARCHALGTTQ